jgi:hypothetical protein
MADSIAAQKVLMSEQFFSALSPIPQLAQAGDADVFSPQRIETAISALFQGHVFREIAAQCPST